MNVLVFKELEGEMESDVLGFLRSCDDAHINQYPGWESTSIQNHIPYYYIVKRVNQIICYCKVYEYNGQVAIVNKGPIFKDQNDGLEFIEYLILVYKQKGFDNLKLSLGIKDLKQSHLLIYSFYRKALNFQISIEDSNKNTLILSLDGSEAKWMSKFSNNHKRNIKKAIKLGLQARVIDQESRITEFAKGVHNLYIHLGINSRMENEIAVCMQCYRYMKKNNCGFFLEILDEDGLLVGGNMVAFYGTTAIFLKGFSNPERRRLPINHLGFFEAFKLSKGLSMSSFDFGGYDLLAEKESQRGNVSRFKQGFRGELTLYPMTLIFKLKSDFRLRGKNLLRRVLDKI